MKKQSLAAVIMGTLLSPPLLADSTQRLDHFLSLSLEELVSLETTIATATKRTASKAPAVVTLLTADDIKATGATNLVDILQTVPGLHIRYNHFGNRPLVQFRGTVGKQTLIMVNGSSLRDLNWNMGIFWKGMPVSIIDRVEIIRGPGSALFGADASAGVVNVITKTASRIHYSEAGVRTGSFGTQTAWLQHGANIDGYEIGFTADLFNTDGHSPLIQEDRLTFISNPASSAPDEAEFGWQSQDLRFSIAKEHWRLHADYARRSDVEIGFVGTGVLDPRTKGEDTRFNIDLFYNNARFTKNWTLDSELRFQHLDYNSGNGYYENPPGFSDTSGTYPDGQIKMESADERRISYQLSSTYSGIDKHSIRIGAGYTWTDLYRVSHMQNYGTAPDGSDIPAGSPLIDFSDTESAFAPERTRQVSHVFVEDVWTINDKWELTAGARYDDYNDFGDTFNPRLALVWQTSETLTSKLLYGQAFRPPTYTELFAETFTQPNPDLDPERSETIELAFSYHPTNELILDINLFYLEQTDLISRSNQNLQEAHSIRGLEFESRWHASKEIKLLGNFTVRSQDDNPPGITEANREAYLRADWKMAANLNWNFQTSWIGERERRSNDPRNKLPSHAISDTTLRYAHSNSWEFSASIRNLFDKDAREFTGQSIYHDLPLAERNYYIEARYAF